MKRYFVFDVESIGLHGQAFAVGGGCFLENGAVQWEFRIACDPALAEGSDIDRKWVHENVPPIEITASGPKMLRDLFWAMWSKGKREGCIMAADCAWPVEGRFLNTCIEDNPVSRAWEGPYPLVEISSVLMSAGMDPVAEYDRLPSEPKHDPLGDARQSARLLSAALHELEQHRKIVAALE